MAEPIGVRIIIGISIAESKRARRISSDLANCFEGVISQRESFSRNIHTFLLKYDLICLLRLIVAH